jgi:hypothetical protein
MINNYTAKVGSQFVKDGYTFTVHAIIRAGEAGDSYARGPHILGWIRPGGYGASIDSLTKGVEWIHNQTI